MKTKHTGNWFDVYLCTATSSWSYECKMFKSFLEADDYYTKTVQNSNLKPKEHENFTLKHEVYEDFTQLKPIMLDICKYTPYFLRKSILNYKIGSMHKVNINV